MCSGICRTWSAPVTFLIISEKIFRSTEAVPRLVDSVPAGLVAIIQGKHGYAELVTHLAGDITIVECRITVFDNHKNVLTAAFILNLEIGKEIILNLIGPRIYHLLAELLTAFVEILFLIYALNPAVLGCDTIRNGVEVKTGQESVGHALRTTAVVLRTVGIRDGRKLRCLFFKKSYKLVPHLPRFTLRYSGRRIAVKIRDASERIEKSVIVVAAEHLEFSTKTVVETCLLKTLLYRLKLAENLVAEHGTGIGILPYKLERKVVRCPRMVVETLPVTVIRPVVARISHGVHALVR